MFGRGTFDHGFMLYSLGPGRLRDVAQREVQTVSKSLQEAVLDDMTNKYSDAFGSAWRCLFKLVFEPSGTF